MTKTSLIVLVLIASSALGLYGGMKLIKPKTDSMIKVFVVSAPYSADPLDYDAFVHHVVFRSVYSSLVTQYKLGSYTGVLASSWNSEKNFKSWSFEIRPDLSFENGEPITADAIALSFKRLAYVMKKKGSSSEVFDNLIGIERLESPSSDIDGIQALGNKLVFTFSKPVPKILDIISFGLYGVVHQSNFDSKTGAWLSPKRLVSSGPYKIESWSDTEVTIVKRDRFISGLGHPKPFQKILFFWDPLRREEAELVMGDSIETDLKDKYQFYGGANSSIAYVRCRSWALKSSPCSSKEFRRAIRNRFYSEMEALGFDITRSFFPLAIKSIEEMPSDDKPSSQTFDAIVARIAISKTRNPVFQGFNKAVESALTAMGVVNTKVDVPRSTWMKEYEQNLSSYSADFYMLSTGILLEEPMHDIKFMFFSKEGVRLPDETGVIVAELKSDHPDIQRINHELWEQAIIWPVTHYASGFWSKGRTDFSLINLLLPPSDFHWLGEQD
jgi:hypothetical protein